MLITFESTTQLDFLWSWSETHCCVSLMITCLGSKSLAWYMTIHYFWKNINCNHLIYLPSIPTYTNFTTKKKKKILLKKNVVNHISLYYIMYYSLSSHTHLVKILIPIEKFVSWRKHNINIKGDEIFFLIEKYMGFWWIHNKTTKSKYN